jgi:minor extracellular serine protease Vpr
VVNRLFFSLFFISCILLFFSGSNEQEENNLQKSIQLVGDKAARLGGFEGQGIKVGIIDTGIDFNHPDLLGYGPEGKVVGGYDFVSGNEKPIDTNGHGTEVAGIVAADGSFTGVAPKSKLFAYKVSNTGDAVSSDYIVDGIQRAIQDDVNVINISLGINKTNDEIDTAIDNAVSKGIVVVVAAGNNGPQEETIGSPGKDINAITVGASYNNITSSHVATLEVGNKQYQVLPMVGTSALTAPVEGKIIYGSYGRLHDLQNLNVKDSILLEERGSNISGEKVYFSEKEKNAANMGAKALIVFNNESGIFFGELVGPNKTSTYTSKIPVISMSNEDGQDLKSILGDNVTGLLNIFYHPDFIAPFSSRGPVSPFYIKPDLVAPGVFVNSTELHGEYNLTSGTSVATPHVTGAVAVLLQKHPELDPASVASLITTTTDPVTDPYGKLLPIDAVGSGRLNITRALESNIIISPHSLVFTLSFDNRNQTRALHLQTIDGSPIPKLEASFSSNRTGIGFDYLVINDTLNVKISDISNKEGNSEGFIIINDTKTSYRIPVLIHLTKGTISVNEKEGVLYFSLDYPDKWSYAKVTLTKAGSDESRATSLSSNQIESIPVYETGQYWVLAQIKTGNQTDEAYQIIYVNQVSQKSILDFQGTFGIPMITILIISSVLIVATVVGLLARYRQY